MASKVPRVTIDLSSVTCKYCGTSGKVRLEMRLVAKELGTFSLAGAQPKVSAYRWPWAVCDACGHESRGQADRG